MTKWLYLSHMAFSEKSEGTFFSLTLKVEEEKMPSDSDLEAI